MHLLIKFTNVVHLVAIEGYEYLQENFSETRFPVIRTHPVTGNKSVYVSRGFTHGLRYKDGREGPGIMESSDELLDKLAVLPTVPEYQCRFQWQNAGDLIMWDNRNLMHYAVADYGEQGPRWMDHIATLGTTPV